MQKTIVEVLVDGKVTLTVSAEIRPDGTLWSKSESGVCPMINGHLLSAAGVSRAEYGQQARAGKFSPEVLACCLHLGENPGGRVVRDKSEADRERLAAIEANRTPAERERIEIDRMFLRAERCDRSEDDEEYRRLRYDALARLEQWKKDYPAAADTERADRIRDKAAHERDLAAGAMLYDADGWLSHEAQCQRRDEFLARAAELDAEAEQIEGEAGVANA